MTQARWWLACAHHRKGYILAKYGVNYAPLGLYPSSMDIFTFVHLSRWAAIVDDELLLIVYKTQPSPTITAYLIMPQVWLQNIHVWPGA